MNEEIKNALSCLSAETAEKLKKLMTLKPNGRFVSVSYESEPSGIRKSVKGLFLKKNNYVIQTANYNNYKSVRIAKESGLLGNGNSSTKNEHKLDGSEFVYYNTNTKKFKLRVPVNSVSSKGEKYSLRGTINEEFHEVNKEVFYETLRSTGWKPREPAVAQEFRSFDIEKLKIA